MRKSKRFAAVALVATFGLLAAACGDDEKKSETTSGATETTTPCVAADAALMVGVAFDTGGRGDGTFNDSAGRGADKATCELGATIAEIDASTPDDRQPNLETLTDSGNNPIIAVGFAFGDRLAAVATANPET